jgi:hypothetical protein
VEECREAWSGSRLVFKPIVSADSLHTFVFDPSGLTQAHDPERIVTNIASLHQKLEEIWSDYRLRGIMAQPYLAGVEDGEISATFVRDQLIGAVKKRPGFGPMPAITRVPVVDSSTLRELSGLGRMAIAAIAARTSMPVRTRLDVIPHDDGMRLLEVEMVDPNCNFSTLDQSVRNEAVKTLASEIIASAHARYTVD